jgi:hypothetical protein
MKTFKEVYNEIEILSNILKKEGYKGVDVDIKESLFFYGFVCKETEYGELEVIISTNNGSYELINEYFDDDFEIGDDLLPKFHIEVLDFDDLFNDKEVKDFDSKLEEVFIDKVLNEKINIHEYYQNQNDNLSTKEVYNIVSKFK